MPDETTQADQPIEVAAEPPRRSLRAGALIAAGLVGGLVVGTFAVGPALGARFAVAPTTDSTKTESSHAAPDSARSPYLISDIVLNPSDSRGTRFLLVSVGFQLSDAAADSVIKLRDAETRDRVIHVLGGKTLDELVDASRRDEFRREIMTALDSVLGPRRVRAVFFPQFVVQ
jgi:flagellar basal body-associated protein FliL